MALPAVDIRARARFSSVARTTRDATTSVRLWVRPPARKKRRRTRPDHHYLGAGIESGRRGRGVEPGDGHRIGRPVRS